MTSYTEPRDLGDVVISDHAKKMSKEPAGRSQSVLAQLDVVVPVVDSDEDAQIKDFFRTFGQAVKIWKQEKDNKRTKFRILVSTFAADEITEDFRLSLAREASLDESRVEFVDATPYKAATYRARALAALLDHACETDDCVVATVNVDIEVGPEFLQSALKEVNLSQNIFCPIIFSSFYHETVSCVEAFGSLGKYSKHRGVWHKDHYGVTAFLGSATKSFRKSGTYETGDLCVAFNRGPNSNIVRQKQKGLIRTWSQTLCYGVSQRKMGHGIRASCGPTRKLLRGSKLGRALYAFGPQFADALLILLRKQEIATFEELERIFETSDKFREWLFEQREQHPDDYARLLEKTEGITSPIFNFYFKGMTGAGANCSGKQQSATIDQVSITETAFSGTVTISCRAIRFRAPLKPFRESDAIITGVLSGALYSVRRQTIRSTWLSETKGGFFLVAGRWEDVEEEFTEHQDLIWIDEDEAYSKENSVLTYKTTSFFAIVNAATKVVGLNYSYVFKTDDDSYVAMDKLKEELQVNLKGNAEYWGRCPDKFHPPFRDPVDKWSVSYKMYPEPLYPRYCQGAGFALRRSFVECAALQATNARYLPFEDAFVGILSERCNVQNVTNEGLLLRMYRSDVNGVELLEERQRVVFDNGKIDDGDWLPDATMIGKILQHRINSDADMFAHHHSVNDRAQFGVLRKLAKGMRVERYFEDRSEWVRVEVIEDPILVSRNLYYATLTMPNGRVFKDTFGGLVDDRWRPRSKRKVTAQSNNRRILIGVTASRSSFQTRVKSVSRTWARELPKNVEVRYFVGDHDGNESYSSGSQEDIKALAAMAGIEDPSTIVVMKGVNDPEYPLVMKASAVIKQMNAIVTERESEPNQPGFGWIADVDDDTYVNVKALQDFVSPRNHNAYHYLGRRGIGGINIREKLKLAKPYCMGGPGILYSQPTLQVLAREIDKCQARDSAAGVPLFDDVIIGKCLYRSIKLGCWDAEDYNSWAFLEKRLEEEIDDEDLNEIVTLHDFKVPGSMEKQHQMFLTVEGGKEYDY